MKKVIIISSYIVAPIFILFGGLLIVGSCSYSSSAGPMNINLSSIFSLIGLLITISSMFRFKEHFEKHKTISAIIIIIYAIGLFIFGQYVIYDSKKFYENLNTMADVFPPNPGCLAIYYLTSFISFMFGLILLADEFKKNNRPSRYL